MKSRKAKLVLSETDKVNRKSLVAQARACSAAVKATRMVETAMRRADKAWLKVEKLNKAAQRKDQK